MLSQAEDASDYVFGGSFRIEKNEMKRTLRQYNS